MKMNNQNKEQNLWNKWYKTFDTKDKIIYDDWLDSYKNIIHKAQFPILDLGCGYGNNALYLTEQGKQVVACDFSEQAINIIKKFIPQAGVCLFDMTKKFPFRDQSADLIIADLCLHYFDEETTFHILNEIKRLLIKGRGHLLFRVNSVKDLAHGAMQGQPLAHHLFFVEDYPKRFFDKKDLMYFFQGWEMDCLKENIITRHDKAPKFLWEGLAHYI